MCKIRNVSLVLGRMWKAWDVMLLIIFRSNLYLAHCIKQPPTDTPNGRGNFISITSASISEWPWDKSTDSVRGRKKTQPYLLKSSLGIKFCIGRRHNGRCGHRVRAGLFLLLVGKVSAHGAWGACGMVVLPQCTSRDWDPMNRTKVLLISKK